MLWFYHYFERHKVCGFDLSTSLLKFKCIDRTRSYNRKISTFFDYFPDIITQVMKRLLNSLKTFRLNKEELFIDLTIRLCPKEYFQKQEHFKYLGAIGKRIFGVVYTSLLQFKIVPMWTYLCENKFSHLFIIVYKK